MAGTITLPLRSLDPTPPGAGKVTIFFKSGGVYQIDENAVVTPLAGVPAHKTTHQNGGSDQISVAGLTGLLATAQTPAAHASTHQVGGSDQIEVSSMKTTETDTTKRLAPNGTGGVSWATGSSGSFDDRDLIISDHFTTGNLSSDTIGKHGWRLVSSGTGSDVVTTPEAGHPGVLDFGLGTVAAGRGSIYLGEAGQGNFILNTTQNTIVLEWLVKFSTTALSALNLTRWTCGFGEQFGGSTGVQHVDGVYVDFEPGSSANFRLRTASASTRSTQATSIAVAANTWYRIGIRMTYPGGVPTAELLINGTSRATLTTNIPSVAVGVGVRGDAVTGATEARFQVDYCTMTQVTSKET